ncbi:UNVERIFIED_CONTAM: hypothetical protein FKN15_004935 [Acipenser sinensis]
MGYAGQLIVVYASIYYISILAWALFYFFHSFSWELPWASCRNTWNTGTCVEFDKQNLTSNWTVPKNATSPAMEFWERRVLKISGGIEEVGSLHWEMTLCLLLAWIICYFCVWKGVKSTGKVVYFTATFPYLMLVVLLIRGLTLPGAMDGIIFYLYPDPARLADPQRLRLLCLPASDLLLGKKQKACSYLCNSELLTASSEQHGKKDFSTEMGVLQDCAVGGGGQNNALL